MIALPIPLIVSLLITFLFIRAVMAGVQNRAYLALLSACAMQGLLVSLVQYYGISDLRLIVPITATLVPPLAWVALQTSLIRPFDPARDGLHALVPAFTLFCVIFAPLTLDILIPVIYVLYALAILWALHAQRDGLPTARLEAGPVPVHIWRALAAALLLSAVSDVLISLALAYGRPELRGLFISTSTPLALFAVGLLSSTRQGMGEPEDVSKEENARTELQADSIDKAIMAQLEELLTRDRLYLDTDLTLARLARRMGVPMKVLSGAINRCTGENISRYVNGHRIRHACERLRAGIPVIDAMLESGFNTKSNFNREFRRVMGTSPSAWLGNVAEGQNETA